MSRPCAHPSKALRSSLGLSVTSDITFRYSKMPFAQLVIGPPGSGKSTYCDGMQQFMGAIERKCSVVNLDPANDSTSYQPAVDVRDLVTIDEIMEQESLGPNGGVLFALEELEHNFDWLEEGLKELGGRQQILHILGNTC
jgi:GTPase SAR1 family protein